jgi:hypothetical protein
MLFKEKIMLLSKTQKTYLINREKNLIEIIASKPAKGFLSYQIELELVRLLGDLHIVEVKAANAQKSS